MMPFTVYTHDAEPTRPTVLVINKDQEGYTDPDPAETYLYIFDADTDATPELVSLEAACEASDAYIYVYEDDAVKPTREQVQTVFACTAET